jgi:hypothetical protein
VFKTSFVIKSIQKPKTGKTGNSRKFRNPENSGNSGKFRKFRKIPEIPENSRKSGNKSKNVSRRWHAPPNATATIRPSSIGWRSNAPLRTRPPWNKPMQ